MQAQERMDSLDVSFKAGFLDSSFKVWIEEKYTGIAMLTLID